MRKETTGSTKQAVGGRDEADRRSPAERAASEGGEECRAQKGDKKWMQH